MHHNPIHLPLDVWTAKRERVLNKPVGQVKIIMWPNVRQVLRLTFKSKWVGKTDKPNVWSTWKSAAKIKYFVQNQLCLSPGFPSVGPVELSQSY